MLELQKILKILKGWKKRLETPPAHVLDADKNRRMFIAQDWREILIVDVIIWFFLIASIHQLAFVFGRGDTSLFSYLKAIGTDGTIWLLSRGVAKRSLSNSYRRDWLHVLLWVGLVVFLAITTISNTLYELWDQTAPPGMIAFSEMSTGLILFTQILSSSFIALIILFLTFIRAKLRGSLSDLHKTVTAQNINEVRRQRDAERARERRARERAARVDNERLREREEQKRERERVLAKIRGSRGR